MRFKELFFRYQDLLFYAIIGGFCAGLDFGVYSVLCFIMPYLWANVISTHCGIFCSFLLNRQYNFKVKDKTIKRFFSFYTVGLLGLGISSLLLYILVDIAHFNELICKLLTIVIVAIIQFLLNKFITFKNTSK
ncbi:MAG: GtrA family protein [Paludibacteraceae bacterium]|nr:GtrA family protein [Paludibacteraceae bacterium]